MNTCAVIAGGELSCWGYNADGELGDGMQFNRTAPFSVPITGVTAVAVGVAHTCVTAA